MALPVPESLAQRGAALWAALHGGLQRGGFALRLALICALTAALALHFQAPEAALSVYVVLFMNKPDRASSLLGSVALVGVINVPIIYFSVVWWNTLHQGSSVSMTKGLSPP